MSQQQLAALFDQAKKIEQLNDRLCDQLRSKQMIEFFVQDRINNPESPAIAPVIESAKQLKSYPIVMYGLKEFVDATLEQTYPGQGIQSALLESKAEIENKPQDWLNIGDILTGFSGVTTDVRGPRVVVDENEDGYLWRYLAEPNMEPRPANHDRWFRRRDWILCEVTSTELEDQLAEIELIQESEIAGLQTMLAFLNDREFMSVPTP